MRPGPDRRDDLLGLRRGEDELQVRRRLLDELEQGVEALPGHHVRLVHDVDLEAARDGGVKGALAQVTRVVDAAMRGRIDLDHVNAAGTGGRQGDAGCALSARVRGRPLLAVERAREDPGAGSLAAAARAAEQVRMLDSSAAQRLAHRLPYPAF